MRRIVITCVLLLTVTIGTTSTADSGKIQFNLSDWFKRIADFRAKFDEKCAAGCIMNYDTVWGMWETFREPIENLIEISGISVDIYPGLRDKILESCVDKTVNYCEPNKLKEVIGCGMPLAKPYIGDIIKIAKANIVAVEAVFSEYAPKAMEMLDKLKCEKSE